MHLLVRLLVLNFLLGVAVLFATGGAPRVPTLNFKAKNFPVTRLRTPLPWVKTPDDKMKAIICPSNCVKKLPLASVLS